VRRQRRVLVCNLPRQPCGSQVHGVGCILQAIVRLGDGIGVEGVGLDDIGAGVQVGAVDAGDDAGLREAEQVVVALQAAGVVPIEVAAEVRFD